MVFIPSRPPFHRQNRRRERPGARTRRALSTRESIKHDFDEGISIANDCCLRLLSEKYPICTCNCWRWEDDLLDHEDEQFGMFAEEQVRLFGGDVGDDELRWMGILHSKDYDSVTLSESQSTIKPEAPPQFSIRPARRRKRHSSSSAARPQFHLPEYLASSLLSDNPAIAPWLLAQTSTPSHSSYPSQITIQHRPDNIFSVPTPQSLPTDLASSIRPDVSYFSSSSSSAASSPLLFPLAHDDEDLADSTWDFITSSTRSSAPPSEPETWILLE